LDALVNRFSLLRLAAQLNEKKTRLAVLIEKKSAAIGDILDEKTAELKIKMASLDALSPLAVLSRGFSIVENERGEIVRDTRELKQNEDVKIRLSRGKIKAKILSVEK
ncbi:exodeoxyribonuclease VII large subunit, partial [Clavibacter michiganensis]|uniref:exodeoxyribonuclease VII large subunit n=1 Tax=Clavibacter michiganensis TaxID=28447 RepID=UPI00292E3FCC